MLQAGKHNYSFLSFLVLGFAFTLWKLNNKSPIFITNISFIEDHNNLQFLILRKQFQIFKIIKMFPLQLFYKKEIS
jgi:hypothetical protein